MIKYTIGDITKSNVDAIVNTVNTVGVMGKGIALSFKKVFPDNYKEYKKACKHGEVSIGKMFVTATGQLMPREIINFPTKKHWRNPSKYEYIKEGLKDLVSVIKKDNIRSIAIPPLGCGNGGLDWDKVKPMIIGSLKELGDEIELVIHTPGHESEQAVPVSSSKLTPPRAMLLSLMRYYQMLGENVTPIIAQKLAYFLQRSGEPLRLKFDKGHYGPYAHQLTNVLEVLSPHFIKYRGNITSPYIQITLQDDSFRRIDTFSSSELTLEQKARLETVKGYITGFENALGLELLATIDYAMQECPDCSLSELIEGIHNWTERKRDMMPDHLIRIAYERVMKADEIEPVVQKSEETV